MILEEEEWVKIETAHAEQMTHNAAIQAHVAKMDELLGDLCTRAINECKTKEQLTAFINMLPAGSIQRTELRTYLIETFGSILNSPSEVIL